MKIVILRTNTSDFGKVGTYNVQEIGLANALIKKGHDVSVIYLNRDTETVITDESYNYVYYLPHKTFGLHGIFDVNLLAQFNPEKVILFSDNQLWAKNVILWCKKRDITCVQYMGGVLSDNLGFLHQFYTKLILLRNRKSYHYSINVAKTTRVQREMEKHKVPFTKVISIGLDSDLLSSKRSIDYEIRSELGYSNSDKVVLFVGRIIDFKKPFLACDIAKELYHTDDKYRLILIGKGPLQDELKEYIEKNKMDKYVKYIERVPYTEIYKYMVASDCLINLSSKEIFGMTILEAMYYELPVVAHKAPGPNDIIDDGVTGILCDTDDVKTWCALISEALNERQNLGKKANEVIEKRFLWDSIAEEFLAL